jgi:hypothetical protein
MTAYAKLLESMMDAIRTGDTKPASTLLRDKKGFPPQAQLAVYTEGYRLRLKGAIESTYPALRYYLGSRKFAALADGFIAANPSRSFNLDKYTIGFGPYAAKKCDDAFARDLAMLEHAIHDVYQREETAAIDAGWAQSQSPEALAGARLMPRAASCLLAFDYPADTYFSSFREEANPGKPPEDKNWLIVLRHRHQVRRLPLAEAEYQMLSLLAEGMSLSQALDDSRMAAHLSEKGFAAALRGWLPRWVNEGILRQPE